MSVAIAPGSPEHMRMITPSKVSAILGISRFTSPYRIWHQMRGNLPPEPASEIFARGHDFEPAMAEIWRRENEGWRLSRGEVQIVCEPSRFGFPAAATVDRRASRGRARKVVEARELVPVDVQRLQSRPSVPHVRAQVHQAAGHSLQRQQGRQCRHVV